MIKVRTILSQSVSAVNKSEKIENAEAMLR